MQRGTIIPADPAGIPTEALETASIPGVGGKTPIQKSFRQGDRMPPHHAPVDVVVLVLTGQMEITLGDETGWFRAGEFVCFPAWQLHALTCLEDAKVLIYK